MPKDGSSTPAGGLKRGAFLCRWAVPEEGFVWCGDLVQLPDVSNGAVSRLDPTKGPPWLVCKLIRPNYMTFNYSSGIRWYSPLDYPKLHRKFAKLEPNEDSIIRFANQYGFLNHEFGIYKYGIALTREDLEVEVYGEPLAVWRREIIKMKRLIELWHYIVTGDNGKLASIVRGWDDDPPSIGIKHEFPEYGDSIQSAVPKLGKEEGLIESWKKEGEMYSGPVMRYIIDEINDEIELNSTIKIETGRGKTFEITVRPKGLLGAMYVLFAFEVSEYEEPLAPRICPMCGDTFSATTRRQKFCSARCRGSSHYYHSSKSKRKTRK